MNVNFRLEVFEGPLDLLLRLIEKNKIDIYDIPIGELTDQYISYISDFKNKNMENISEFLVMAATLIEIKSSMLLPKTNVSDAADPREELVNRLEEYKKFKEVSRIFDENQFFSENYVFKTPDTSIYEAIKKEDIPKDISEILDGVDLSSLYQAFQEVLKRQDLKKDKRRADFDSVERDLFTIEDKIQYISDLVFLKKKFNFFDAFKKSVSKQEVVVTFLAVLELIKTKKIYVEQNGNFSDILISAV